MDSKRFDEVVELARERQDELLEAKGRDYTRGADDRLVNFKRWGTELDVDPVKVLGVYMGKHIDSVVAYIKSGGQAESEPIKSRMDDLHNYLYLLEGMLEDVEAERAKAPKRRASGKPASRARRQR